MVRYAHATETRHKHAQVHSEAGYSMTDNTTESQDDIIEGTATPLVDQLVAVALDRSQDAREASVKAEQVTSTQRTIEGRRGGTLTPFDSTRARAAANARWEARRQAADAGLIGAISRKLPGISSATAAYGVLVGVQAELALDKDYMAAPAAFRNVSKAIGADAGAPGKDEREQGGGLTQVVVVSDAAAAHVLGLLRARDENK